MNFKKTIVSFFLLTTFLVPTLTYAVTATQPSSKSILRQNNLGDCLFGSKDYDVNKVSGQGDSQAPGSCNVEQIFSLANNLIQWMVGISGALALFMFIMGGMWMIFSGGNSSRVDRGKDILIGTSIALIFLLGSWIMVQFLLTQVLKTNFKLQDVATPSQQPTPSNAEGCCIIKFSDGNFCEPYITKAGCDDLRSKRFPSANYAWSNRTCSSFPTGTGPDQCKEF